MPEFEDVIKYIAKNLSISITQTTEFGPVETINVELYIGDVKISESNCNLPTPGE